MDECTYLIDSVFILILLLYFIYLYSHFHNPHCWRNLYFMDWYAALSWTAKNVRQVNAATDQSESGILESSVISDTTSKRSGFIGPCPINMAFHYLSQGLFVLCAWPSPGSDRTLTSIIWGGHLHTLLLNDWFYCSARINALSWRQHIITDWPVWPTALIYAGTTQPYSTVKPTPGRSLRSVLIVLFYRCVLRA